MGNAASRHSDSLVAFSDEERVQLMTFWASCTSGAKSDRQKATADLSRVEAALQQRLSGSALVARWLTAYFQETTRHASGQSSTISLQGFAAGIFKLGKGTMDDRVDALRTLLEVNQISLFDLTQELLTITVPAWFAGSDIPGAKAIHDIGDVQVATLGFLSIKLSRSTLDDALGLQTDTAKSQDWKRLLDPSTNIKSLSPDTFSDWFKKNASFQTLVDTFITIFFLTLDPFSLPPTAQERFRKSHVTSPKILSTTTTFSRLLTPLQYYYLTIHLPHDCLTTRSPHTLIYSSHRDGNSWQIFQHRIENKGSTLIVIKDKDGKVFGGFAHEPWRADPKFYGSGSEFLFSLDPLKVYGSQGINVNYMYFNYGRKSLANGLGMGGQVDYFGLYLSPDYGHGHSKAEPLCSTYGSPQLSGHQEFQVDEMEVWLLRPVEVEDTGTRKSVLDRPEDVEFLEMSGRKMYSKEVRAPDVTDKRSIDIGRS
ncbi:hypothetical protein BZG36_03782 [Bifiguratus adelaidae]|uniref:MTOR-associated protein MEAK7 n=1 Tax=Bifiguratus adelaidae TaxID=1938954 RepID=A0A261XXG5_9FUNG|nr:hypothetical protein BZG36_03782 [Bifiguratus adelaidae]